MEIQFYHKKKSTPNRRIILLLALMLSLGIPLSAQMSGSYTIDKNGTATATNFQSFTSAYQALKGQTRSDGGPSLGGGVSGPVTITVAIGSGPYTEQLNLQSISGASATNRITIEGNGETIQKSASSSSRHTIWMNGIDYLTLKDLHIKTLSTTYGYAVRFSNNADYNIIEECDIDFSSVRGSSYSSNSYYGGGVIFSNSSSYSYGSSTRASSGSNGMYNKIRNNYIHGKTDGYGGYVAVSLGGRTSSGYAHYNEVTGNEITGFRYYGVYIYYSNNNVVSGNDIHRAGHTSNSTYHGYACYSYYSIIEYTNNKIHDFFPGGGYSSPSFYGIYAYYYSPPSGWKNKIENNAIWNINGNAYYRYGIFNGYAPAEIYHNTISFNGSSSYSRGMYVYDYNSNSPTIYVKNNNVHIPSGGQRWGYYINGNAGAIDADHNNIYVGTSGTRYYGYFNGNRNTKQDFQNSGSSSWDVNGQEVESNFTNLSTGDLTPRVIELDGSGEAVGVATDIAGNPRNMTNPDIGVMEFDIPINVSSINFPTTICQGEINNVDVVITNSSTIDISDFKVQYEVDGVVESIEVYPGTINAGTTGNYTFTMPVTSDATGNFVLKANVTGKSPVQQVNYQVNPSPVGSEISAGSTFEGLYASGTESDPDIVAYGDNITYEITPPTGFNNSDFNSTWTFDYWELTTEEGTSAGSSHGKTNPTTANAESSFIPVIGQSDSTFMLRYAIRSLANGCVAPEVARTIFVAPRPVVSFTGASVCEGQPMQFVNNSTISSGHADYKWRFGDGDSTVLVNPSHKYSSAGTYDVELVAISNYGYEASTMVQVSVKESPMAEFAYTNQCEGTAIPFVDGTIIPSGSPVYSWDFGDGNTSTMPSPSHTYAQIGTYEVILSVTASGCTDKVTHFVTQAPRPTVSFSNTAALCNNEEISFTNNSSIVSGNMGYEWDFKDGSNKVSIKNPVHKFNGAGSFDVTLTARTDLGCVESYSSTITLIEGPTADFGVGSLCDKANISFTNNTIEPAGSTVDYTWNFGEGNTATTKDPVHSFGSMGMYDITLTATSDNGCEDVLIKSIDIGEMPTADFYVEDVCEGEDLEILNASVASIPLTYNWNIGSGNTSTDENPVVSLSTGTHTIDLTVTTPQGCSDNISKTVEVKPMPTVVLDPAESGEDGEGTLVFTATTVAGADYIWFFGDGGNESGNTSNGEILTTYRYLADGKYNVELRVTKDGCSQSAQTSSFVSVTGLADVVEGALMVYPNPGSGKFIIDLSDFNTAEPMVVKVFDAVGKLVQTDKAGVLDDLKVVDLSSQADGLYYISLETRAGKYTTKVTLHK